MSPLDDIARRQEEKRNRMLGGEAVARDGIPVDNSAYVQNQAALKRQLKNKKPRSDSPTKKVYRLPTTDAGLSIGGSSLMTPNYAKSTISGQGGKKLNSNDVISVEEQGENVAAISADQLAENERERMASNSMSVVGTLAQANAVERAKAAMDLHQSLQPKADETIELPTVLTLAKEQEDAQMRMQTKLMKHQSHMQRKMMKNAVKNQEKMQTQQHTVALERQAHMLWMREQQQKAAQERQAKGRKAIKAQKDKMRKMMQQSQMAQQQQYATHMANNKKKSSKKKK
jgi:hypothetical protein